MAKKEAAPEATPVEITGVSEEITKKHEKIESSNAWKVAVSQNIIGGIVAIVLALISWKTQQLVIESANNNKVRSTEIEKKVDETIEGIGVVHVNTNDRATKQDARIEVLTEQVRTLILALAKTNEREAILKDREEQKPP